MIGLVFFFEDFHKNVYSPMDGDIQIWRETAKATNCSHLFMVDTSVNGGGAKYAHNDAEIVFARYTSLEAVEAAWSAANWVYCDVTGAALASFAHPAQDAIYVVGPDSGMPVITTGRAAKTWVKVPSRTAFWSLPSATIVLADRYQRLAGG